MNIINRDTIQPIASDLNIPMAELGGIITSPSLALIGEGMVSEVIIPLNKFGMNFITESINQIIENKENNISIVDKKEEEQTINRYIKHGKRPDKTLYDMKLLSNSIIGI
jgi:hypothetical protein